VGVCVGGWVWRVRACVRVTVDIIEIFLPQDSELLQERQLKEDLLQQTEVVSKFQETERKSAVYHTVYHNIYIE